MPIPAGAHVRVLGLGDDGGSTGTWTVADVLLAAGLIIVSGYVLYKVAEAAITRYRESKPDHKEYLQWKRDREQQKLDEQQPGQPEAHGPEEQPEPAVDEPPGEASLKPLRPWTTAGLGSPQASSPATASPFVPGTEAQIGSPVALAMILFTAFMRSDALGNAAPMTTPADSIGSHDPATR